MACNCKKKAKLEEEYGVKESETIFYKFYRHFMKIVMFVVALSLVVITVPIMMFYIIFTMFFKKNKVIVLPKWLGKYLK